jgi:hypothetical protein
MVMESRQRPVTAFHRRGGALKGLDLLSGPGVPRLQDPYGQPQGEGMLVQRRVPHLLGLPQFGLPTGAARVGDLVFPRDPRQEHFPRPCPPQRGGRRVLEVLRGAPPPKSDQGRQSWQGLPHLRQGVLPGWSRLLLSSRCNGIDCRL